jgi:formate/nitrite transporter FocA (FNT family)
MITAGAGISVGVVLHAVVLSVLSSSTGTGPATVLGAVAFSAAIACVVVGRLELLGENVLGAAALQSNITRQIGVLIPLALITAAANLAGGALATAVLAVEGALPPGASAVLAETGTLPLELPAAATIVRAILAGILVALLSYLLAAVEEATARLAIAGMAGFLLVIGPFDHAVVSVLQILFGAWTDGDVPYLQLAVHLMLTLGGNIAGALAFVLLTVPARR